MTLSTWHAYASRETLATGTELLVTGGTERIRLLTADQISIEMPDRNRVSAVVVDYNDDQLLIAVGGGALIRLLSTVGESAFEGFKLSDGFSRQRWTVQ